VSRPDPRAERLLDQAVAALQQGQTAQAETLLRKLEQHPEARALRGQLCVQQERHAEAIPLLEAALAAFPGRHDLCPLLGAALHMEGYPDRALPWYRRALAHEPGQPAHRYNLASALKDSGALPEAAQEFAALLAAVPGHLKARNNYAGTLLALGQTAEAADQFQTLTQQAPDYALAWYNLGEARSALHQWTAAEYAWQQAARLWPEHAPVRARLGRLCQQLGELEASAYWLQEALQRSPDDLTLWRSLGMSQQALGQWPQAEASFREALNRQPDDPESLRRLGQLLREQGQSEDALHCFESAWHAQPDDAARIRLATFTPPIYDSLEDVSHWRARSEAQIAALREQPLTLRDPLSEIGQANFYLAYQGYDDRALQSAIAGLYRPLLPEAVTPATPRPAGSRHRVAFLSGFWYHHSVSHYYRGHVLGLDPEQFEVWLLLTPGSPQDQVTEELSQAVAHTVRLPHDLAAARQQIADLHLQALIYPDIGMEPFSYFLAFTRLAPLQAVLPGHPVTTGIPTLDYFISNQGFESPEASAHYSEQLVTLPGLPVQYRRPHLPTDMVTREQLGLKSDQHLYLCPMTLFKIHPVMDAAFGEILARDPHASLQFFRFQQSQLHQRLAARFERTLGPLAQRIQFRPWAPGAEFFSLLAEAAVVLDSHPFGGGSTHFLTLATGTPLVSWRSPWLRGRSGAGLLNALGLSECLADSGAEFAQRAVAIATDSDRREALRTRILAAQPELFDNPEGPQAFAAWLTARLQALD
jgi:protein O-GlcNAc transferase